MKKLTDQQQLYRIRVGYQVSDRDLLVLVLKIGHRKEIYRQAFPISAGRVLLWNRMNLLIP